MDIKLVNGAEVFLYGYVSLYERTGSYQFYVENAEVSGKGALEAQFLALRKKLEEEGLFDEDFKRDIPAYAEDIAVITSPDGAAVRDIIGTIRKKNEKINIKIILKNKLKQKQNLNQYLKIIKIIKKKRIYFFQIFL